VNEARFLIFRKHYAHRNCDKPLDKGESMLTIMWSPYGLKGLRAQNICETMEDITENEKTENDDMSLYNVSSDEEKNYEEQ